jgi:outer membrane receptor protein involved in Fe transport
MAHCADAYALTPLLDPVFVTASRSGEAVGYVPFSHEAIAGDALRESPNVTVDGLLRAIPGFSPFRRSDSLVANPSSQGVSLRGLGPTGASRSLVLLDGVPLTDAFGGWVLWSKLPRESLARVELVPGAGGTAWGNAALGGVVQFFTDSPVGSREKLSVRYGSYDTRDIEAQVTEPLGAGTFQLLGRYLATDGYAVVAPERRGAIDRPASSRARWATARWRQTFPGGITATLTARAFADDRGNGTPYQRNSSDERFASVQLTAQPTAQFAWNATSYAQNQNFTSTFSSVNTDRSAETPASNQFDVPATVLGAAWVGDWSHSPDARTTAGVDVRDVRGENREDSGWINGAFTRRRISGGRQTTTGVFASHRQQLAANWSASAGVRLDGWMDSDGHRRDTTAAGELVGDQRFARHDGLEMSPSLGVIWIPARGWRLHASGQQAFRRPTLNELYRPFRVGNVITDANPALRTERVTSGEIGAAYDHGPFALEVTGFVNELRDGVVNVTIARGPTTLPGLGFVPAGGEARRKLNLDASRVQGVALNTRWTLTPSVSLDARFLYDDTQVRRATVAPWLVGRRLAQVPRDSASVGTTWKPRRFTLTAHARWVGDQFDDDANSLRLAAATLLDASAAYAVRDGAEMFVAGENLFDHRLETGRSPDGLVNIGSPRLLLVGVRLSR